MKPPLVVTAFLSALTRRGLTQTHIAAKIGLHASTLSFFVQGRRPSAEMLRAVCGAWENQMDAVEIICAHLHDEIERSGLPQSAIRVEPAGAEYNAAVQRLAQLAQNNPTVAQLLADLLILAEAYTPAVAAPRIAAENRPGYGKKGGNA